tara:strand:- start:67 stop:603 length:537 start_codon:yes stop_codon:yes gene_type:complete
MTNPSVKYSESEFKGLYIVEYFNLLDDRGKFVKPWVRSDIQDIFGNNFETYFSSSKKGVLRGLHYQIGNKAQKKYVTCLKGKIEDIALDLRENSSTYGQVFRKTLNEMDGRGLIIPEGFAHGIFAHEESIIVNFCDKVYSPGDEAGISPTSLASLKDLNIKILSDKDQSLPDFKDQTA